MAMSGIFSKTCRFLCSAGRSLNLRPQANINPQCGNFTRTLFSGHILGLEGYKRDREQYVGRIGNLKETFRSRMEDYMEKSEANSIFTDDLKTMLHIAETEEDIKTTVKMIKRYQHQRNDVISFADFKFGPVVMRLFHLLNNPDSAYELYMDESLNGFFDQLTSARTLMDLLFETGNYSKVFEVFENAVVKKVAGMNIPNDCVTLYMAACSKVNTPESYEKAKDLLKKIKQNQNLRLSIRSIVYITKLALDQGEPAQALEFTSMSNLDRANALNNVKMLVFSELGRTEEALNMLRNLTVQDQPQAGPEPRNCVFKDVVDKIDAAVQKSNSTEQTKLMENMKKVLEEGGLVQDRSFEEHLYSNIVRPRRLQDGARRRPRGPELRSRGQESNMNRRGFAG